MFLKAPVISVNIPKLFSLINLLLIGDIVVHLSKTGTLDNTTEGLKKQVDTAPQPPREA